MKIAPYFKFTLRPKKLTLSWDVFHIDFKFEWNLSRYLSCPSSCVHIKNMWLIYLSKMNCYNCCVLRKLVSISSMKIQAYGGVNFVEIAVSDV